MIKVRDLTDIGDGDYNKRQNEYMLCQDCGEKCGGTRGDYWSMGTDHIFVCVCGSKNIALVKDITTIKIVKV